MRKIVETFGRSGLHPEPAGGAHSAPDPPVGGEEVAAPPQEPSLAYARSLRPSVVAPMKTPGHALVELKTQNRGLDTLARRYIKREERNTRDGVTHNLQSMLDREAESR